MLRRMPWAALAAVTAAAAVPAASASAAPTAAADPVGTTNMPAAISLAYPAQQPAGPNSSTCDSLRFPTEQAMLYGSPAVTDSLVHQYVAAGCGPPPPI